ncbi:MAG: hypothetical protein V4505_01125 [Pseudomonadota bacterium]
MLPGVPRDAAAGPMHTTTLLPLLLRARTLLRLPRRAWAYALLLALLLAPLLGTLHAVVHPPGTHLSVTASTAALATDTAAPVQATATSKAASWLDRLFGHQAGGSDCRLFDQLCQGHALPSAATALPVLLPAATVFVFFLLGRIVQRDALFHARAPPAHR